jgi:hypothetical protein
MESLADFPITSSALDPVFSNVDAHGETSSDRLCIVSASFS